MNSTFVKWIPIIVTVAGTVGAAIFTPTFITAHPAAFAYIGAALQILHAVLPSLFSSAKP